MIQYTDNPGIDYGLGQSNIDKTTGIRYGVICLHALGEFAYEEFEADYGPPTCEKCGGEAIDFDGEKHDAYKVKRGACSEYACETCERVFDSDDAFGDEPICQRVDSQEYTAVLNSDGDVMLLKSLYYTYAQFCSPCAPGAGHLENPCLKGVRTYCFDKEWYPNGKAPFEIFEVGTGICKWLPGE